jgi:hypothetical protein
MMTSTQRINRDMEKENTKEIYYYSLVALAVLTLYIGHIAINKKSNRKSHNRQSTSIPPAYTVLGEDTLWYSHTPDTAYRQGWDTTGIIPQDGTAYPNKLYK